MTAPVRLTAPTAEDTVEIGRRLGGLLRAGDLVLLVGDLGAGKTTLVRGIGERLEVHGTIASPTFVISRVHRSLVGGPALVHADAYRLGDRAELDDLDLDAFTDQAVTVVEWGGGVAEGLATDRLEVTISRARGDSPAGESREVSVLAVGPRWSDVSLSSALTAGDRARDAEPQA